MPNGNPAPGPLNSRYFRPVRGKETRARRWDLQFESTSLQQRVHCEPDAADFPRWTALLVTRPLLRGREGLRPWRSEGLCHLRALRKFARNPSEMGEKLPTGAPPEPGPSPGPRASSHSSGNPALRRPAT